MKLTYSSIKDEDLFVMTNFDCTESQHLLYAAGLYKILWCKGSSIKLKVDGYEVSLKKDHVIFCTPLNVMEIPEGHDDLVSYAFNKEFFCIQTHDDQVSCNGFLFFGSSQPQIV